MDEASGILMAFGGTLVLYNVVIGDEGRAASTRVIVIEDYLLGTPSVRVREGVAAHDAGVKCRLQVRDAQTIRWMFRGPRGNKY